MAKYDFFIAHAGADLQLAETLYDRLKQRARCFIDSRDLEPGDDWDRRLPEAQADSRITIVLVSTDTDRAFYEREEIAAAIRLARTGSGDHRVVPVFAQKAEETIDTPYGLGRVHALEIREPADLDTIVSRLFELLRRTSEPQPSETLEPTHASAVLPSNTAPVRESRAVDNSQSSLAFLVAVDLVRFSLLSTDQQVEAYSALRESVHGALTLAGLSIASTPEEPIIWSPGGDGGTLSLRTDARAAFQLAEAILNNLTAANERNGTLVQAVLTLHAGLIHAGRDLNGTPNVWGEAINVVNHLLAVCEPNEIIASAAFVDYLISQSRDYGSRFGPERKRALKHGRLLTVRSVTFSTIENRDLRDESEDKVDIRDFEAPFLDMISRYEVMLEEAMSAQSGIWSILLSRRLRDLGRIPESSYRNIVRKVSVAGQITSPHGPHHELFSQFDDNTLQDILSSGLFRHIDAGDYLCHSGDDANEMFIVAQGRFDVIEEGEAIAVRRPGDLIGEMALIEPITQELRASGLARTADLYAPEEATVFSIPYRAFEEGSRDSTEVRNAFRRLYRAKRKESIIRRAPFFEEVSPLLTRHDVRELVDWARLIGVSQSDRVEVPSDVGALILCGGGEVELHKPDSGTRMTLTGSIAGSDAAISSPGSDLIIVGVDPAEVVAIWGEAWRGWIHTIQRSGADRALWEGFSTIE